MCGFLTGFWKDEDGLGTVEIVIIIAVLVGLALIFRKAIFEFVNQIFDKIFKDSGEVVEDAGKDVKSRKLGK